jgi:electron transfer flavoprotein alpha subunit
MTDNNAEHKNILVLVEREGLSLAPITFELLGMGRSIADDLHGTLCAVLLGHDIAEISGEIASLADEVYCLDHPVLAKFGPELYAHALMQLCQKMSPHVVLMGCTLDVLNLAPRLACRMGVEVVTDCVDLKIEPNTGYLLCVKPVYGAKVISTFLLKRKPYVVTFRPKAAKPIEARGKEGKIIRFNPVIDKSLIRVELIERIKEDTVDLEKADAVVAGGRGIRDAEGIRLLGELIEALKKYFRRVGLGASRPLVDMGLVPPSRQIGLTGEKIAPELYIAVGISGSLQHMTGILGAKKIVAINNSPDAPIFSVADYGIVGNFQDIIPALRKKLEESQ